MIRNWYYQKNKRRIKILKAYIKLIEKKGVEPKQAADIVCKRFGICRKTIYNYYHKFKNIPLRSV